ncbi:MAG: FecR domain-containing protein, partial [Dehalococcoidales bacterium]
MNAKLLEILDECLEQIQSGERIESCLAEYPHLWEQLEPLLTTAWSISALPKVSPSDEFRRIAKARLLARIRQESIQAKVEKSVPRMPLLGELTISWQRIWHTIIGARRVAIPVTIALFLLLGVSLSGAPNYLFSSPALASQCTLSILSGSVEVQKPGTDNSRPGNNGMTLTVGTRIKTAPDSHALLTFFEGSTLKLEPNSDVEIQQVESTGEQSTTIILKQWLGRTWSRVVKMADPGSHYQIETPSATAIVRGTLFATEVDENGFTKVSTIEGLVSVVTMDKEVQLPANKQAQVETGTAPAQSLALPNPKSEILIMTNMPALGSVTDPTGSSTGNLPSGLSFNQILGSQSLSPSEDSQLITIVEPVTGEYIISLRYLAEGIAPFSIQGISDGEVVFAYTGTWGAVKEGGWLIHLNLQVKDGQIVGSEISSVEPLGQEGPEEIVETEMPIEKVAPTKLAAEDSDDADESVGVEVSSHDRTVPSDTEPDHDEGTPGDTEPGHDEGTPGDTEPGSDEGTPGDTEPGSDEGTPGDIEPGHDEGTPGDTEPGHDEGTPGDTEPGHDKGTPGDKGPGHDKGTPDNKGPGSDKGTPGNKGGKPDKDKNK